MMFSHKEEYYAAIKKKKEEEDKKNETACSIWRERTSEMSC